MPKAPIKSEAQYGASISRTLVNADRKGNQISTNTDNQGTIKTPRSNYDPAFKGAKVSPSGAATGGKIQDAAYNINKLTRSQAAKRK